MQTCFLLSLELAGYAVADIRSLSSDDDDAEDEAKQKKNFYFTRKIRDCLDLLGMPMAVKNETHLSTPPN